MRDLFIDISRVEVLVDLVKAASTDINQLIELQTEIGVYSYYIAEHCGLLHEMYIAKEYARKQKLGEYLRDTSDAISKAKEMFYIDCPEYRDEKRAESNYRRIKMQLEQLNNINQNLNIKISNLKQERQSIKSAT